MQNISINSKANQGLITGETSLSQLPLIIHNTIRNWETQMSQSTGTHFLGYEELGMLMDIHPQTLRKWSNQFTTHQPKVSQLISLCKLTQDWTAWNYVVKSVEGLK